MLSLYLRRIFLVGLPWLLLGLYTSACGDGVQQPTTEHTTSTGQEQPASASESSQEHSPISNAESKAEQAQESTSSENLPKEPVSGADETSTDLHEQVHDAAPPEHEPSDMSGTDTFPHENPVGDPHTVQDSSPSPESVTDAPTSLQANSVSVIASFFQNHPQSGLMEQTQTAGQWELSAIVPAGNHQLMFRLNHQTPDYGVSPSSPSQWPVQASLVAGGTAFSFSTLRPERYHMLVDLSQATLLITREESPTAIRLESTWNQQPSSTIPLLAQTDGSFQADIPFKKGSLSWKLGLQYTTGWKTYGVSYPARGILPQGGTLVANGQSNLADISQDGTYRISYHPLYRTFVLEAKPIAVADHLATLLQDLSKIASSSAKMARVDIFISDIKLAGKLPWVAGQKLLFLLRWSQATAPVYVAGSFNQWSTTQHKMTQVTGTDLYWLELTLPVGRYAYKFVDSSTTAQWITDPGNPAFEYGTFGPNSIVNTEGSSSGELRQHPNFFATQRNNRRTLYVYLPPEYYKNLKWSYPVLYMHDGQNLFDPSAFFGGWKVDTWIDSLHKQGKIQPPIVVGIANTTERFDEYTHTQDKIQGTLVGGKAKEYADFLLREVKPWIDGTYRTLPARRHTSTMGSSLGGLVSLWLGYQYPDAFFRIGALSSTFGWGKFDANNPTLLDIVQQETRKNLVIYLDSGSPNDNYQDTLAMRNILQKKGYQFGLNLQHWVETGASHNEKAWNDRLFRPLEFLLSWP